MQIFGGLKRCIMGFVQVVNLCFSCKQYTKKQTKTKTNSLKASQIAYFFNRLPFIYGRLIDLHDDQLPLGLKAQLVEHCTGIAEARVPGLSRYYLGSTKCCEDLALQIRPPFSLCKGYRFCMKTNMTLQNISIVYLQFLN